jgi:hypothetical protein
MLPYPTPPTGGGLYLIRFSDTHYYGGRTCSFRGRWAVHRRSLSAGRHPNAHMQAVYNQTKRFEPEVLCFTTDDNERRNLENAWLQENVGQPGCLNLSRSADGVHAGYKHSEATRAKHRRPVHTDESKEKCRQAAKRPRNSYTSHPHTQESRAKISASTKQAWALEKESGVKRSGFSGPHSEEAKVKMTATRSGRPHPHIGVAKTQEQKDRQADASRAWWDSLTTQEREAQSAKQQGRPPTKGMTGRKHSPETKRKMSETWKAKAARGTIPEDAT